MHSVVTVPSGTPWRSKSWHLTTLHLKFQPSVGFRPLSSLEVPESSWAASSPGLAVAPPSGPQTSPCHVKPEIQPTGDERSTAAFNPGSRQQHKHCIIQPSWKALCLYYGGLMPVTVTFTCVLLCNVFHFFLFQNLTSLLLLFLQHVWKEKIFLYSIFTLNVTSLRSNYNWSVTSKGDTICVQSLYLLLL